SQDDVMCEVLARELACGLGVTAVVAVHPCERVRGLVDRRERDEPFPHRERTAEPRVLRDDRPTSGEVGGAPVAEPPAAQAYVLALCDRELPPRGCHVAVVAAEVGRDFEPGPYRPPAALEQHPVRVIDAAQRQLERHGGPTWQVEHLEELMVLGPV